jgi:hypothetical protein
MEVPIVSLELGTLTPRIISIDAPLQKNAKTENPHKRFATHPKEEKGVLFLFL